MSTFFTRFGIQPVVLIAQIINFSILALILFKLVYKPILKVLDTRRERIESSLRQAKELDEKNKKSTEEYQRLVEQAKQEADTIVKQAKTLAEKSKTEILEQAQQQALEIQKKAELKLEQDREMLEANVRSRVVEISLLTTEKVLRSKLDPKYVDHYVNEVFEEMKR